MDILLDIPEDYEERKESVMSNMHNSVNDQLAAQQQTVQYLDPVFDGSSLNDKVPSETSCEILNQCSSLGFNDSTEVCFPAQTKTTEQTYFPKSPCLSNEWGFNIEEQATNLKEHMCCVSVNKSNSNGDEKGFSFLRQAHHSSHRTSKVHEQSCKNVSPDKCMESPNKSCTDNNATSYRHISMPGHHLKFETISAEPNPVYLSTSDSQHDNSEKDNSPTLTSLEHFQPSLEITSTWTKSEECNPLSEKEESITNKTKPKCMPINPPLLTTATHSSCKVVRKIENGGAHMLYDTPSCSQSYSSCELSSFDTHNTSLRSNSDRETDYGQITQKILNTVEVYDDSSAHYNFLGQLQSLTETEVNSVSTLENASKERKSENNFTSPQTPADFLEEETAQVDPYKDNLTPFAKIEHEIDSSGETSFVNSSNIGTPVTMKKSTPLHSLQKRKLLKMTNVPSTIQEASKSITDNSGKDLKKIKIKAVKKYLRDRRADRCQKSGKVTNPASLTNYGWNRCVKSSQMFRHHIDQVFKVSSGPQPNNFQKGSQNMNRLLGCFKDSLKTEIHNEQHNIMVQNSGKALQSNTINTLLKTPSTSEKAVCTELNGDAAFELSMQSTINSTGFHFCIANAFNKRENDERSRNSLMAVSEKATDLSEMDVGITSSICGANAISLKHSPIQKVDRFTQYLDEDYMTTINKDTFTVTDAVTSSRIAKKYINCKFCRQTFRHISACIAHQRIHTGEKPYRCELCGKKFAQLSKLRSHRNVHVQSMSWPCPCCRKKFSEKGDLVSHLTTHVKDFKQNNESSLQNSKLDAPLKDFAHSKRVIFEISNKFNNRYVQKNHKHDQEKLLSCRTCGKEFWTSSQLVVHEKTHWPVKPYACSICAKGFNQIRALKKHSQKHTGETPFSCSHCGCEFSDLPALRVHQISKICNQKQNLNRKNYDIKGFLVTYGVDGQVNTPVFFKCQICKQLCQTWCQYTLHLQTHTKSPPYLCFACGQSYEKNAVVNVHCRVCCQISGEEVACGSSFPEILNSDPREYAYLKDTLQTDQYSTEASKGNSLSSAGQFQKNSETLSNLPTEYFATESSQFVNASHLTETVHLLPPSPTPVMTCASLNNSLECVETPTLRRFKCPHCGQRYKRYRTLSLHMQTHAHAFRYTCRYCGQSFERWNKLWLHQRIHCRKVRCYTCSQCNVQFHFFSTYKMHLLSHAEERPYACSLCPQTFALKEGLHVHQYNFHRPSRKLQCDVCARSFSNFTNLVKHSLLHNGIRSHQCLSCNLSFANNKHLQEHLNTHNNSASLLPSIPSEPLTFLHKCNICKSSFSNGDLLYAHQICHTRDLKRQEGSTEINESTSVGLGGAESTTSRSLLSTLNLDAIPKESLFKYPHPDMLYVSSHLSSMVKRIPIINLDSDGEDYQQEASTDPVSPNCRTGQSISGSSQEYTETEKMHQPQALKKQDTIQFQNAGEIPVRHTDIVTYNLQDKATHNRTQMIEFVETSVFLEGPTTTVNTAENEMQDETLDCADCSEKLDSGMGLYEHYLLHALGNTSCKIPYRCL
ncbi:zinc finger protein 729 [Tachysurus vachellii]|uniref:zinc finger protein 729 n=1 Tax=Tachysurus vachellii TaxID=175792 RepID=UPI00296B0E2E|nr:zinc finger protein 729 [Tachysurus vachellii]